VSLDKRWKWSTVLAFIYKIWRNLVRVRNEQQRHLKPFNYSIRIVKNVDYKSALKLWTWMYVVGVADKLKVLDLWPLCWICYGTYYFSPRIKVRAQQLGIGSWKSDCHQACELPMGQATVSRSYFVLLRFFLLILEQNSTRRQKKFFSCWIRKKPSLDCWDYQEVQITELFKVQQCGELQHGPAQVPARALSRTRTKFQ